MRPILEARGLSKVFSSYGSLGGTTHTTVGLQDISFSVEEGEVLGVVGESGSGKTTLVRCLAGLETPTSGAIHLQAKPLAGYSKTELARRVQIVFQGSSLDPRIRVFTSLSEALKNRGVDRGSRIDRATELLTLVGLPPAILSRFPRQLSGGQRQRIAIARALAMEPEVLLLDEPVSNLDVSVQARVINLLLDLQGRLGLTLVVVSHDLNVICYLSHHIVVLREGRIVEANDSEAIIKAPAHDYTTRLFASSSLDGKGAIP